MGNREVSGFDSLIEYGNSFIKNCRKNNSFSDGQKKHSSFTKCPNKDKFYKRSEEKSTVSLNWVMETNSFTEPSNSLNGVMETNSFSEPSNSLNGVEEINSFTEPSISLYDGPFRIYFIVVECYWNGCISLRKVSSNQWLFLLTLYDDIDRINPLMARVLNSLFFVMFSFSCTRAIYRYI